MKYIYRLIIRVCIAFLLFLLPFNVFYLIFLKPTLFLSYLSLIGYKPELDTNLLIINGKILVFTSACIATSAYYLFSLLVLLVKDLKIVERLKVLCIGFLLILAANVVRIVILIFVYLNFNVDWFNNLHIFFWKFVSGIYVALTWIFLSWKFKIERIPAASDILELNRMSIFGLKKRKKTKRG